METTFVNRANSNEEVYRRARVALGIGEVGEERQFLQLSERHGRNKLKLFAVVVWHTRR